PLVLRYYKRMSYAEIARTLNRRLPAVKTILFRAKSQLRRNLARQERQEEAGAAGTVSELCFKPVRPHDPPPLGRSRDGRLWFHQRQVQRAWRMIGNALP